MPAIKLSGKSATRPVPRRKAATKTEATKPAARKRSGTQAKAATTKRGPGRPRKQPEPVEEPTVDRRTAYGKADPKVLARYEDALKQAGDRLKEIQEMKEEALGEIYELSQSALSDNLPMAIVSDLTGVSRQWLYNMGNHAGRSGSVTQGRRNGAGKPAAKRTSTRKPAAAKKTAAKTGSTRKPAAKASGTKKLTIKRK